MELLDELSEPDAYAVDVLVELRRRAEDFAPWPEQPLTNEEFADLPEEAKVLEHLAAAFAYQYSEPANREGSSPYKGGQWKGRTEGAWPPPLSEVDQDVSGVWEDACARTQSTFAKARLHDLLFLSRHGDVAGHIRGAVNAYVQTADACQEELRSVEALQRALEIAVSTHHHQLRDTVASRLIAAADASLEGNEHKPGVTLGFLEPLVRVRVETEETRRLLWRTRERYTNDWWISADVIELQRAVAADAEEQADLDREVVQVSLDMASKTEGLLRHYALERAATLARERGISDLRDEAVQKLEAMTPEELGLQVIEESVELSPEHQEAIERWFNWILEAPDPLAAVKRLLGDLPPSGDLNRNRQQVEQHRQEFVFSAFFPPKRLAYEGMPHYSPTSEEERTELELAQQEELILQVFGPRCAQALARIGEHYDPDSDKLAAALATFPRMTFGTARSLARALAYYWNGEYEASTMIALPRAETAARALLTELGEPLFSPQTGSSPGRYPTLGSLLDKLREHGMDESWCRYLATLLTSPGVGLNVRNDRLHGLVDDDVGPVTAALVLIAVLYLVFSDTPSSAMGRSNGSG